MHRTKPLNSRNSFVMNVGGLNIGGSYPIRIQSMTNTETKDVIATIKQIKELEELGCELIRVSVPDNDSAISLKKIKENITIPLVADIHFDYKLAIKSFQNGADCVRINPGNLGSIEKFKEVIQEAKELNKAIRIGVNAGSLEKNLLNTKGLSIESLIESALKSINVAESMNFRNYKVSIKTSSVPLTVAVYESFASVSEAPLHIGVTEAGTPYMGTIKSAIGIGSLLLKGVGDTIRVSLTGDPKEEITAAWGILNATQVRRKGVDVISCPTCARTGINLIELTKNVESICKHIKTPITVAVMGCVVNGPGEAKDADFGIAAGQGEGLLFAKGKVIKKVPESELLNELKNILKGIT